MKLPNEIYDIAKWLGLIALPAIAWFIGQVGGDIGIAEPEKWVRILNASGTLLGLLIGASCMKYEKEKSGEVTGE